MIDFRPTLFAFENRFASGLKDRIQIELRELTISLKQVPLTPEYLPPICNVLRHCQTHLTANVDSPIKQIISQLINVAGRTFRMLYPKARGNFEVVASDVLKTVIQFLTFEDDSLIESACSTISEIADSAGADKEFICRILEESHSLERIISNIEGNPQQDLPLLMTLQTLSNNPTLARSICEKGLNIIVSLLETYSWSCKGIKPLVEILYNIAENKDLAPHICSHDIFLLLHPHVALSLEHIASKDSKQARNTFFATLAHLASEPLSHCLFATSTITSDLLDCATRCPSLSSAPRGPLDVELVKLYWIIIRELCEDYRNLGIILEHDILSTITPFFIESTDRGMFHAIQESILFTLHRLSKQVPSTCLKHNVLHIMMDFLQETKDSPELCKRSITLSLGIIFELVRYLYIDVGADAEASRLTDHMFNLLEAYMHLDDVEHCVTETLQILAVLSPSMTEVESHRLIRLLLDLLSSPLKKSRAYSIFATLKTVIAQKGPAKYFIAMDGIIILLNILHSNFYQILNDFKELTILVLRVILDLISAQQEGREFLSEWRNDSMTIYDLFADIWISNPSEETINTIECIMPYLNSEDLESRRASAKPVASYGDNWKVQKFLIEIDYHHTIIECSIIEKALEVAKSEHLNPVSIDEEYLQERHEELLWATEHQELDLKTLNTQRKNAEMADLMNTFKQLKEIDEAAKRKPRHQVKTGLSSENKTQVKRLTKEEKNKMVKNSLDAVSTEKNILSGMEE